MKAMQRFSSSFLFRVAMLAWLVGGLAGIGHATDFTWEGINYRDVKVVEVDGDKVTLESKKKERITVPRERLVGFLKAEADDFDKNRDQIRGKQVDKFMKGKAYFDQNAQERAWIYGSASHVTADGFLVASSEYSLPQPKPNRNGEVREARKTKGGARVYTGTVFVKGMSTRENTNFDRVLWRDGWFENDLGRYPAFVASKPQIRLPNFAASREWTNSDGKKMTATLKQVKEGKGQFVSAKGKVFVYDLEKLSDADQEFIKEAQEKYDKEVAQLKKDYPWLKFD